MRSVCLWSVCKVKLIVVLLCAYLAFLLSSQRSGDLNDLEVDYESKQSDLDVLQNEVVKLEGIVAAISENVRGKAQSSFSSASTTTITEEEYTIGAGAGGAGIGLGMAAMEPQTPVYGGSPANRLAKSAASAAMVARQLAAEEERQFSHSMNVLSQTASQAARQSAERASATPFRGDSDVQRSLQSQLNELEMEVQNIAADRRRGAH